MAAALTTWGIDDETGIEVIKVGEYKVACLHA